MNLNLISLLIVSGLSLHVLADRNGDRGSRWNSGQNNAERTYTAPAQQATPTQQTAPHRTYTPSQPVRSEPARVRTEPVTLPQQPTTLSRNTFQDTRSEPGHTARSSTERASRDRTVTYVVPTQPAVQPTQPVTLPRQPTTPSRNTFQDTRSKPEHTAHVSTERMSRQTHTQLREPSRAVQSATPKTDRLSTEKDSSPVIFANRASSRREHKAKSTRTPVIPTSPISHAQHQAVSLRSPQHVVETRQPTYNNTYYSHHYPSHTEQHYRPVTCYNRSTSFWQAFGVTIGASLFAPFYIAPVVYPPRSYYSSTGYIHDGWHYSSAYYGGWRGNWYGGFSYIFNPTPVYSSYYLYDEPQTLVVQQPKPQVVYINQPAQQVAPPQEAFVSPLPVTTQPPPALVTTTEEAQLPPTGENAHCFCACKCNGRVPCICEYACGSEFSYSPENYTLKGFASYAESLNKELIWSSYAGLDRAEPESLVAEAAE